MLATFLRVTNQGWMEAFAHPHETALMICRVYQPGGDVAYQEGSVRKAAHFATLESPQLGEMKLSTWQACCTAFHFDPKLIKQVVDFTILKRLYPN